MPIQRAMRRATRLALPVASITSVLALAACGPAGAPTSAKPPEPPKVTRKPLQFPTPARWTLRGSDITASTAAKGGGALYVGRHGERWWKSSADAPARPAESFVEDDFEAVSARDDGSIAIVGSSGTVYQAKEPLAPLSITGKTPAHARGTAASKDALFSIVRGRELQRSLDGGTSWSSIALPKIEGRLTAVEFGANDRGLLLAMPQAVFSTVDAGKTWNRVGPSPVPVKSLELASDGALLVADAYGKAASLSADGASLTPGGVHSSIDELNFPGQSFFTNLVGPGDQTAVDGDVAFSLSYDQDGKVQLVAETLGHPGEARAASTLGDCENPQIAAAAGHLVVVCLRYSDEPGSDGSARKVVLHSTDQGKTFREEARLFDAGRTEQHVWVGANGSIVVKGACVSDPSGSGESSAPPSAPPPPPCDGHGVIKVAGSAAFVDLVSDVGAPSFYEIAWTADGKTAWAVGTGGVETSPDEEGGATERPLFAFRSTDGGRSFKKVPLPPPERDADGNVLEEEYDEELGYFNIPRSGAIAIDEDGKLRAVAVAHRGRWKSFASDDDGLSFHRSALPKSVGVAFVGARGYVQSPHAFGFESLDAGRTWSKVAAPVPNASGVACSVGGCVVGAHAERAGWALEHPEAPWAPAPPAPKVDVADPLAGASIYGWKCEATDKPVELGAKTSVESAMVDAPSGDAFALVNDDETGVTLRLSKLGKKELATKPVALLGAPKVMWTTTTRQSREGVAVVRAPRLTNGAVVPFVPKPPATKTTTKPAPTKKTAVTPKPVAPIPSASAAKPGTKPPTPATATTIELEVAWWSASTGRVHHATIKDAPSLAYAPSRVTAAGLVVTSAGWVSQHVAFAISNEGVVTRMPDEPLPTGFPTRDVVRAGKGIVSESVSYAGAGLVDWLEEPKSAWKSAQFALWNTIDGSGRATHEPAWLGAESGFFVAWSGSPGIEPGAWWVPTAKGAFDPNGVRELTLPALGSAAPQLCGKDSVSWPRVSLPQLAGRRHWISVDVDGLKADLATTDAIMRVGPKGEACVSAYRTATRWATGGEVLVVLEPHDGSAEAAIVRWPSGKPGVAHKASCTASSAAVPSALRWEQGWLP